MWFLKREVLGVETVQRPQQVLDFGNCFSWAKVDCRSSSLSLSNSKSSVSSESLGDWSRMDL